MQENTKQCSPEQKSNFIDCRIGCGACCIAPSISSPIPGMPQGKPGGTPCIHLTKDGLCRIFTSPDRPRLCAGFPAATLVCGQCRADALRILGGLEGIDGNTLANMYGESLDCIE